MLRLFIPFCALLFITQAQANCSDEQTWCNTKCEVKHLGDDAAITGCQSKCVAARAACSTKAGAETAYDVGKKAVDSTKSFFKGLAE